MAEVNFIRAGVCVDLFVRGEISTATSTLHSGVNCGGGSGEDHTVASGVCQCWGVCKAVQL